MSELDKYAENLIKECINAGNLDMATDLIKMRKVCKGRIINLKAVCHVSIKGPGKPAKPLTVSDKLLAGGKAGNGQDKPGDEPKSAKPA